MSSIVSRDIEAGPGRISVNRVVIERGDVKQVVYYWFEQRGRRLTSEYLVKWYIFWDALTRNRTDGALVRLTMPVANGLDEADADRAIARFAAQAIPQLARYVPD